MEEVTDLQRPRRHWLRICECRSRRSWVGCRQDRCRWFWVTRYGSGRLCVPFIWPVPGSAGPGLAHRADL